MIRSELVWAFTCPSSKAKAEIKTETTIEPQNKYKDGLSEILRNQFHKRNWEDVFSTAAAIAELSRLTIV